MPVRVWVELRGRGSRVGGVLDYGTVWEVGGMIVARLCSLCVPRRAPADSLHYKRVCSVHPYHDDDFVTL
jgi:hypothetical protein